MNNSKNIINNESSPLKNTFYITIAFILSIVIIGGCSQVVTALDCGSIIRGFDPRHSPEKLL